MKDSVELTILMPCLNESETLEACINKALAFLKKRSVAGEVIVADNGSSDGSQEIARKSGARVVNVPERGYGAALRHGSEEARGKYVIMGDADDSYDFSALELFLERLRAGDDLVMGNRFKGGIAKGAMPPLHRYLGNPVLSFIGRLFFKSPVRDFHCGLRGYNAQRIRELDLRTTGMEYASEMVVQATLRGYKISEVPTTLSPDGRSRPPHLRSWRDGWRHLKFLLMHSPDWLFFYPGIFFIAVGLFFSVSLGFGPVMAFGVSFDVSTMLYSVGAVIVGVNLTLFSAYTKIYAAQSRFIPSVPKPFNFFNTEKCVILGMILSILGMSLVGLSVFLWKRESFGELNPARFMRLTIPAMGCLVVGVQIMFAGFFLDILRIEKR
ncbi:MAG: glycosyltransferase family 2 protein [Synergistaceae bacterium]|nr:glycosyltransferase family 2 protein [Synergistaceae bacterium]